MGDFGGIGVSESAVTKPLRNAMAMALYPVL
jgi:hypothetical protein